MKLFIIISICLSLFSSNYFFITQVYDFDYQCRRVREYFFIQEIEKIFYEVAEEKGAPSVITQSYSQIIRRFARLLALTSNSDSETLSKSYIRKIIESDIELERDLLDHSVSIEEFYARPDFPHATFDRTLRQAYQILISFREQLSELEISIELPNYNDFIELFFFMEKKEATGELSRTMDNVGVYLSIFNRILLNSNIFNEPLDYVTSVIVHEAIHMLFPGFNNPFLNEGMTTLITSDITNNFDINQYKSESTIVKQIQDSVSEEALLRAYAVGSYEPLRGKLDDRIINIFKLMDLAQMFPRYDDLSLEFITSIYGEFISLFPGVTVRDHLVVIVWLAYKNDLECMLKAIEKKLLDYLLFLK